MIWHLRYLWYVLKHKYFVFRGGLALAVPLWQLVIHDLTKFQPIEWFAYVDRMRQGRASTWESTADTDAYRRAWAHHWQSNKHHWEYWTWQDQNSIRPLRMRDRYAREMVADWYGAGMAQRKPDIRAWYAASRDRRRLHEETREQVERLLDLLHEKGLIP